MATDSGPGERQYHLQVGPGEVGAYVLLPGDPARTDRIAERLAGARLVGNHREFRTWTGSLDNVPVSVTSTGVGCPSAAIAVSELLRLGAHTFIRIGSCGALQADVEPGQLIIATGAVRDEGTTRQYVPVEYPAVASPDVVAALQSAARASRERVRAGIVYCKDALTAAYPPESVPLYDYLMQRTAAWVKAGVLASEMESAAIFVLAAIARARAGSLLQVIGPGERADGDRLDRVVDVGVAAVRHLIASEA
jgi:uridine phosphorylase